MFKKWFFESFSVSDKQLLWNKLDDRKIQFCVANSVLLFSSENMLMSAEHKEYVTWFIYFLDHYRICVTDFKEGGLSAPHHPWAAPKRPMLNRVKSCKKVMEFFFSKVAGYNLTKKGLHQRFFPVKFVKLFRAVFNQGKFWQMILHLGGLYEILLVFSTQLPYFSEYKMTIPLTEP